MIYSMTLDPITNVHPARIAAANGGCNPYSVARQPECSWESRLRAALYQAWEHDAEGLERSNGAAVRAASLTRIQLATN